MTTLRVMTYNVHHGAGMDDIIDLPRIARVILDAEPDLVAIQEVDRKTGRVNGVDQMTELAERTGMGAVFSKSIDYDGGDYGNVILTPHEILGSSSVGLPGKEPRSAIRADVRTVDGGEVSFICTHLSLIRDRQWDSIPLLNALADGAPESNPVIMAGDFNTNPESATIGMLLKSWVQAGCGEELRSYPSDCPIEQIDYVFAMGERVSFKDTAVLAECEASDHRPVLTTAVFQ